VRGSHCDLAVRLNLLELTPVAAYLLAWLHLVLETCVVFRGQVLKLTYLKPGSGFLHKAFTFVVYYWEFIGKLKSPFHLGPY
jgi:hypothetical protein